MAGRKVRRPDLTLATVDHNVPTADRDKPLARPALDPAGRRARPELRATSASRYFDVNDVRQGIVHVIGPEQGLTQPGMTIVCGDSHTSTHGAFGALAFGIGTSEVEHVLATQTLPQAQAEDDVGRGQRRAAATASRPRTSSSRSSADRRRRRHRPRHRVPRRRDPQPLDGRPHDGLQHVDRGRRPRRPGRAGRDDLRLPRGPSARAEGRGLGRRRSTTGARCRTDDGATFDTRRSRSTPPTSSRTVTWGTTPAQSVAVTGRVPDPDELRRPARARARLRASLDYMDLKPGTRDRGHRRSTACSSAPAPTPASRTCAPPRRVVRGPQGRAEACARWSCPAPAS